jgi:hypothetical protein
MTALLDTIQACDALLEDCKVEQHYINALEAARGVWDEHAATRAGNMPDDQATSSHRRSGWPGAPATA